MFIVKTYQGDGERLLAICDSDVLGRSFMHNGVKISVNPKFYGDKEYSVDEVMEEIRRSSSINAMGSKICNLLIDHGLSSSRTVLWFDDDGFKIGHVIVLK